jgi:hypothetical protein
MNSAPRRSSAALARKRGAPEPILRCTVSHRWTRWERALKEFVIMEKLMARNEGSLDRMLRVVLGAVLLSLVFIGPQTLWGLIGLIPLVTGIAGTCPIYSVFGLRTCRAHSE